MFKTTHRIVPFFAEKSILLSIPGQGFHRWAMNIFLIPSRYTGLLVEYFFCMSGQNCQ